MGLRKAELGYFWLQVPDFFREMGGAKKLHGDKAKPQGLNQKDHGDKAKPQGLNQKDSQKWNIGVDTWQ